MPRSLLKSDVTLALVMPSDDGPYHPSGPQIYPYYFAVNWNLDPRHGQDVRTGLLSILQSIYAAHRARMQANAPEDQSFIAVLDERHQIIPPDQYADSPWLKGRCPAWEYSNCIEVTGDEFRKVLANEFAASLV